MSMENCDLDTLHCILEQFSKDLAMDYSKLLSSIIKSLSKSILNKSSSLLNKEVFASVKVLLNVYKKLQMSNKANKSELPFNDIIQSIKHVLYCENEYCNIPIIEIQCSIISIVSILFKISLLQNSMENSEELMDLYIHLMTFMNAERECKSNCLIFKLKIINSIYHELACIPNNDFLKKIKLKNNLDECQIFGNLVFHGNENVFVQALMYVIPEYMNCFESDRIVKVIWKQVSDSMTAMDSSNKYFRVHEILCFLCEICFEGRKLKSKLDLTILLLEDMNYWKLLQVALVEKDPVKKKQGMYVLKKTFEFLNNSNRNFVCHDKDVIFFWGLDHKEELYKIYSEIIISLEYLEEQQVHIIKPIFPLIETLGKKIMESEKVNFSWLLLLYKKALMHESTQIVLWGLSNLLNLPENFFLKEYIANEAIVLLMGTLNNMSLYYSKGLILSKELNNFFNRLTKLSTSKSIFKLCIREICSQVWSAEALFFVIHSLSGIQQNSFWEKEEISRIEKFVSKAFNTHNRVIRTGIQCELLNVVAAFTDRDDVGLEKIIVLVSKLCIRDIVKRGSPAWCNFTTWLGRTYSKQECEAVLKKGIKKELGREFGGKFLSLMLILFEYDLYNENSIAVSYISDMFLVFRDIDKRPYCNKLLCDEYLSIICNIYESNLHDPIAELVKPTLPFAKDLLFYIKTQLNQISRVEDFDTCQSYLNSFEIISKNLFLFNIDVQLLNNFYFDILEEFESFLSTDSEISSVGIFWRIKLLSIGLELYSFEKFSFLNSYLLKHLNEPLVKNLAEMKKTRDLQSLWGRMNSEFLEGKWKIFECLIRNLFRNNREFKGSWWIGNDNLVNLCAGALSTGGYGVLCPVMKVLKQVLPALDDHLEHFKSVVDAVWKLIMERRKTEEFKSYIKHFVEMLYQEIFIRKGESVQDMLFKYVDFIFSDSSLTVVNTFMKHVQQINVLCSSEPLFCRITGRGLIFGSVPKKDERLTNHVCHHLEYLNICQARRIGEFNISNEIRGRATQMILMLDKANSIHRIAAKNLMETLFKMEKEINKNRIRYFGNSHVHRVKHRLMQALLLLEPMLDPNEDQAKALANWLYHGLLTENSQPSVRYQQEWLLVRMLLRHSDLYRQHSIFNYYNESTESNKRGLCSVIAVSYHLCKLISLDLMEGRIAEEIHEIFSLCFHQHFEVRLYAQVVFHKLFSFSQSKKLKKIIQNFEYINDSLRQIFERNLKGNFSKNFEKLLEDFYFSQFNPLEHYSLETIYVDLPKLTNVDPDEWISTEMFQFCDVDLKKISIPLKNSCPVFNHISAYEKLLSENFSTLQRSTSGDENSEDILSNYQKKIIPNKPLFPILDEKTPDLRTTIKKGGLIVVASLIDRIPNLGGLARTCEVFGASQYVINSLKYIEEKQFTSLSVTAEKWISVKEVKAQNLLDYIFEMKLDGYTIIGAEQTLQSVPLSSVKFPRKSLLLLGNEKEGIPPNLLPLLDICVEVPQLGIIRSLNVHVTGALFIWEYTKQNSFK